MMPYEMLQLQVWAFASSFAALRETYFPRKAAKEDAKTQRSQIRHYWASLCTLETTQ